MKTRISLFLMLLLLSSFTAHSQSIDNVFEEWASTDGTQNFFIKSAVKTDANGASYIAGATLNGAGNYDIFVAKYNEDGDLVWSDQYNGAGNGDDGATDLVLGDSGNVYVTGTVFTSSADTIDVITIAYDDSGTRTWVDVYAGDDGLADFGTCIGFANGKIFVGGAVSDATNGFDFLCLRYDPNGTLVWDEFYDYNGLPDVCTKLSIGSKKIFLAGATNTSGLSWDMLAADFAINTGNFGSSSTTSGGSIGFARVRAMDIDADDNIYLTGTVSNMSTGYDIHTVMIDSLMTVQWAVDYTGSGNAYDEGSALALDPNTGHVYVGGIKTVSGQGADFVTLKYDLSGSLIWAQTWNDSTNGGDTIKAIVVNPSTGNITVTGSAWNGNNTDYQTIQYTSSGAVNWQMTYNDKHNFDDAPMDIAATSDGGVVVTGQSRNPDDTWSYITVKYLEHAFTIPADSDSVSTSLRWIANRDQLIDTDGNAVKRVKYYSNQSYPNVYFMDDTLSYVFSQGIDTSDVDTLHRVSMTFNSSSTEKKLLPLEKESYWNNYYLAHIPEGRPFVSLYDRLYMEDVWPNIDVVYSSNQKGLKYYLVVRPGGEASAISLGYHGLDSLYIGGNDELGIGSSIGALVQPQAIAYTMNGSGVLSQLGWQPEYAISGKNVSFSSIGSWTGTLVFEVNWGNAAKGTQRPDNLYWSTYLGGSNNEFGSAVCVGANNEVYNSGQTFSSNFPIKDEIQMQLEGSSDVYLAAFSNNAEQLWTTYYGGSSEENPFGGIASFNNGVICTGQTLSSDFPLSPQVQGTFLQTTHGGNNDAFVLALSQSGIRTWSTFFGGDGNDIGNAIAIDVLGGIYIGGRTNSHTPDYSCGASVTAGSFPLCNPTGSNDYFQDQYGDFDGFIAYFSPNTRTLSWSTYFGGASADNIWDLSVDLANDRLYVGGETGSTLVPSNVSSPCNSNNSGAFPLCDPSNGAYFQDNLSIGTNTSGGFIAEFSSAHVLEWTTFFGGTDNHSVGAIAIGNNSNLYVTGKSSNSTLVNSCAAVASGAFPLCNRNGTSFIQSAYSGGLGDNYVARFGSNHTLDWSTLFGGAFTEYSVFNGSLYSGGGDLDIALDQVNNIYLVGSTKIPISTTPSTSNFPNIPYSTFGNWYDQSDVGNISEPNISGDAFVAAFSDANTPFWITLFGGERISSGSSTNITNGSEAGASIATDGSNYLYITGTTGSPNTPTSRPSNSAYFQGMLAGSLSGTRTDAFLSRFSIDGISVKVPNESIAGLGFIVYPNPTDNHFRINLNLARPSSVKILILNMVGQPIRQFSEKSVSKTDEIKFSLKDQPTGIYLIEIHYGDHVEFGKIVKL